MTALGAGSMPPGRSPLTGTRPCRAHRRFMAQRARALGAERVAIACTAIGRDATNATELLTRIERPTGVAPTVLSGEREAALTFQGLVAGGATDELVAADLGGGSLGAHGRPPRDPRLGDFPPVGVRKLTERFGITDPPERAGWAGIARRHRGAGPTGRRDAHPRRRSSSPAGRLRRCRGWRRSARWTPLRWLGSQTSWPARRPRAAPHDRHRPGTATAVFRRGGALEGIRRAFGLDALEVSTSGLREGLALEAIR